MTNFCVEHRRKILLAEDNLVEAKLTIKALRENKINNDVVHVFNGQEVLDYLNQTGNFATSSTDEFRYPELIFLDINMPVKNGLEVLGELKASNKFNAIPIIVLTSSCEPKDLEQAYKLGVNSYIQKPIDFDDFMEVIMKTSYYWLCINRTP